jgi:serine/threonine protein kinase
VNPYPSMHPIASITNELVPLLILHQGHYGKPKYMPPEMYASQPINGVLADNWNLGVILYSMLLFRYPWEQPLHTDECFQSIYVHDQLVTNLSVTSVSNDAKYLLRLMLRAVEPSNRLKIQDIRSHPWMSTDH